MGGGQSGSGSKKSIRTMGLAKLPKTGNLSPRLDDGFLEVPIPDGWHVPPKNNKWLFRMQSSPTATYPTIIITGGRNADVGPDGKLVEFKRDAVGPYASSLQKHLQKTTNAKNFIRTAEPLRLGKRYVVHYADRVKSGDSLLDRLFVIVIRGGRKYTVEMRALRGALDEYSPIVYAVAGRLTVLAETKDEGRGMDGKDEGGGMKDEKAP